MTYSGEPRFNPFPSTYVPVPAVTTVLVFLCFSATQYLLLRTDPRIEAGFRLLYTRSFSISVSSIHVYSYAQLKLNNVLRLSPLYLHRYYFLLLRARPNRHQTVTILFLLPS
jgi:hypothetical protein